MPYIPLRLGPGADLRASLEAFLFPDGSRSGFVVAGMGSLADPVLRFAAESVGRTLPGAFELLTLTGSLSLDGAHLYATMADAQGRVVGGHLCHGSVVRTTAELLVAPVQGFRLARAPDPFTGYAELVVEKDPGPAARNA